MFRFNAIKTIYLRNNARIRKCSNITEKKGLTTFGKIYIGFVASGFLFFPACCSGYIQKLATNEIELFAHIFEFSGYGVILGVCSPLLISVLIPYGFYELAVRTNNKLNDKLNNK